jgi:hypothetical protein
MVVVRETRQRMTVLAVLLALADQSNSLSAPLRTCRVRRPAWCPPISGRRPEARRP